jgi:FdhD protein
VGDRLGVQDQAGIPVLAAVSAPSSLAVEVTREVGITLVGCLRGDGCSVHTRTERIAGV